MSERLCEAVSRLESWLNGPYGRMKTDVFQEDLRLVLDAAKAADKIESLRAYEECATLIIQQRERVIAEQKAEIERLQAQVKAFRNAADVFRTYGLPPHDVSGIRAWNEAYDKLRKVVIDE